MKKILHLDSSARSAGSYSRNLSLQFVESWQQFNPDSEVIYRDLAQDKIPHVDELWVEAYEARPDDRTPEMKAAIALSDRLIDELFAADYYVFGVPMYNLTIPSVLKAYLDQVIRRDRIFTFDETGKPQGLLKGKKALIITTRKFNYREGTEACDRNYLEPYLKAILKVIGVEDVTVVVADELAKDEVTQNRSLTMAMVALVQLAGRW